MSTFTPPTREERFGRGRVGNFDSLMSRITLNVGMTVWKDTQGAWHTQSYPAAGSLNDAALATNLPAGEDGRYVFLGGHSYTVSSEVAAELVTAGFTVN